MSVNKRKYNPNNLHIVTIATPELTNQNEDGTYNYQLLNSEIRVVGGPFYRLKNNKRIRYYFDSITDEIYDDTPKGINILSDGTNHRIILDKRPLLDKYDIALDKISESELEAILENLNTSDSTPTCSSTELTDLVLLTILLVSTKVVNLIANDETKQNILLSLLNLAQNYCQELNDLTTNHGNLPALDKLNLQKTYLNKIIELETTFIEKNHHDNIYHQLANFKKSFR